MKLRNKETGKIVEVLTDWVEIETLDEDSNIDYKYTSLAELNEEWEDYEEPKDYWFIDSCGGINKQEGDILGANRREIGNYFETREDAEKAVEKLKAWKRLKDAGFKFTYWNGGARQINFEIRSLENEYYIPRQICDDLDLLFGGEE